MDSQEIAIGILSLIAPGIVGWDKSERKKMARRINEYTADLVAESQGVRRKRSHPVRHRLPFRAR
jgi:hypothetical protein